MNYEEAIQAELDNGDIILETGENKAGKYTKMKSGKLFMICYNGVMPCESVVAPKGLEEETKIGHWRL